MYEAIVNLHVHTRYSDGSGSHRDVARAALRCGLDAVIVTDHNVWISGIERYFSEGGKRVLVLVGEEIHDRSRLPQKNHLLIFGADKELAQHADSIPALLQATRQSGGAAFVAHPIDPPAPAFGEPEISWESGSIQDFAGIELWNGFSELKAYLRRKVHGLVYAFLPGLVARGPFEGARQLWDKSLLAGASVAIGGSDAHALVRRAGFIRRVVFPYDFHFRAVNTHVLLDTRLTGDARDDARSIYSSLARGCCFVGYDLAGPTRGFRYSAFGSEGETLMGGTIGAHPRIVLHASVPAFAEIRLLRNGEVVHSIRRAQALTYRARESGTYRVEVYRRFLGRRRAWILSNPIHVQ